MCVSAYPLDDPSHLPNSLVTPTQLVLVAVARVMLSVVKVLCQSESVTASRQSLFHNRRHQVWQERSRR